MTDPATSKIGADLALIIWIELSGPLLPDTLFGSIEAI